MRTKSNKTAISIPSCTQTKTEPNQFNSIQFQFSSLNEIDFQNDHCVSNHFDLFSRLFFIHPSIHLSIHPSIHRPSSRLFVVVFSESFYFYFSTIHTSSSFFTFHTHIDFFMFYFYTIINILLILRHHIIPPSNNILKIGHGIRASVTLFQLKYTQH